MWLFSCRKNDKNSEVHESFFIKQKYFQPNIGVKDLSLWYTFLLVIHRRTQDYKLHLLNFIPNLVYLEDAQLSVIIFVNEITETYFQLITIPQTVDLQVTSVEAAGTNIKKFYLS